VKCQQQFVTDRPAIPNFHVWQVKQAICVKQVICQPVALQLERVFIAVTEIAEKRRVNQGCTAGAHMACLMAANSVSRKHFSSLIAEKSLHGKPGFSGLGDNALFGESRPE